MRLDVAIRGDLAAYLKHDAKAAAISIAHSVRQETARFKRLLRAEVRSAGLGNRLANAIRNSYTPQKGDVPTVVGKVFSKAVYKRPGGLVDLIAVFDEGATIRAFNGRFLVIPIEAGKKEKFRFNKESMSLIPTRRGGYLVVYKPFKGSIVPRGSVFKVMWLLVPQTKIRARNFGVEALIASSEVRMAELVGEKWDKYSEQIGTVS